ERRGQLVAGLDRVVSEVERHGLGKGLDGSRAAPGDWVVRVPEDGKSRELGYDLPEQLETLGVEVVRDARHSCDVAAGTREARREPGSDGIVPRGCDDRDDAGGYGCGPGRDAAPRDDDADVQLRQCSGHCGESVDIAGGIACLEHNGPAFDVAEVTELLLEGSPPFHPLTGIEQANDARLRRLSVRYSRSR